METVTYTIILSPADEGGFTVTVPALPAVVTEGDSYEQAIEMAREAIGLYLESLAVRGEAIPRELGADLPREARVDVALPSVV